MNSYKMMGIVSGVICIIIGIGICTYGIIKHNQSLEILNMCDLVTGKITKTAESVRIKRDTDDKESNRYYHGYVDQDIDIEYTYNEQIYNSTKNDIQVFSKKYSPYYAPEKSRVLENAKYDLMHVNDKIEIYVNRENPSQIHLKRVVDNQSEKRFIYVIIGFTSFFFILGIVLFYGTKYY